MLTGTVAESSSIVSISVQLKHNIDAVNEYVVKRIPIPLHDFTSDPRLIVIRSFDISKPGAEVDGLKAAWQAGRSRQAYCDLVWKSRLAHYSPGMAKDSTGRNRCQLIYSRNASLHAEMNQLLSVVPGGLIDVGKNILYSH
jgi:translation initiation factor 2 subunit 3